VVEHVDHILAHFYPGDFNILVIEGENPTEVRVFDELVLTIYWEKIPGNPAIHKFVNAEQADDWIPMLAGIRRLLDSPTAKAHRANTKCAIGVNPQPGNHEELTR
jgi:hypothetical protein